MSQGIKKTIILLFTMALLSAGCVSNNKSTGYNVPLKVGNKKIFVEIANTTEKMAQGLSGREKLKKNQGMLFDFSKDYPSGTKPGFWMKEMKFDLDLIWIREGKIIGITENVPVPKSPADQLPHYYPPANIDMVLEVNAGWSEKNEINIGDPIHYNKFQ